MARSNKEWAWRIGFDVCCLLVVGFSVLSFYLAGVPFKRGFFCDDESIRYPYHHGTISSTVLYTVGMGLNVLAVKCLVWNHVSGALGHSKMLIPSPEYALKYSVFISKKRAYLVRKMSLVEYFHCKHCHRQKTMTVFCFRVHPWFWAIYSMVGVFAFGACCSQLATDIGKYSIGRLRPHFINICQPDFSKINCTGHDYITDFECTGTDEHAIREARLSFPSGHASFSFYTMVYLAMYLQARLTWRATKLLRPFLQFVCLMLAWYTALSRVSDYKHHPTDVLGGGLLGAITAVLVGLFVSDMFKRRCAAADVLPPSRQNTVNGAEMSA